MFHPDTGRLIELYFQLMLGKCEKEGKSQGEDDGGGGGGGGSQD